MTGMLTLNEFAEAIGATYHQVYKWVTKHGLPHIKIGAKRYIEMSSFEEWKDAQRTVQTKPRPKAEVALEEIVHRSPINVSKRIAAKCERIY